MQWGAVRTSQPRLAELGARLLADPGVVLVGTIRRDGTSRISPVEPLFWRDDLWLSMLFGSHKAKDLFRDSRVLVHSIVTSREGSDGEYKVRGKVVVENGLDIQKEYARAAGDALGWNPVVGRFHLFRVDISNIAFVRYDTASGDQHALSWPEGKETLRRATSPTSLGPAESIRDVLLP